MKNLKTLQIKINTYLTTNFGYNIDNDFRQFILDNLNPNMLLPEFKDEEDTFSFISYIYWWDMQFKGLGLAVTKMLKNITQEEVDELLSKNINTNTKNLINLCLFQMGSFPSAESIIEFEYCNGDYNRQEAFSGKLIDPFYKYPEMDLIFALRDKFGFTNNNIVEVLEEEYQDYATYRVGGSNSDMREEYYIYFGDFLIPFILSDKKDLETYNQIEKLYGYLISIEKIETEIKIIELAMNNKDCDDNFKSDLKSRRYSFVNKIKELPRKYYNYDEYNMAKSTFPKSKDIIIQSISKIKKL